MLTYTPGVQAVAEFSVPDGNGDNVSGLTWTPSLYKNGAVVTSGVEFDGLSFAAIGLTGYKMAFTPMTDGAVYMVRGKSSAGDVWEERIESKYVRVEGAPSFDSNVFETHGEITADGRLVDCASASAILYEAGDQSTVVKNLGAGTEGVLNAFHWVAGSVSLSAGLNYFVRFTFTVASPGSPATPVTIVRDLPFST